ncbi:MAG: acylneuraminate cytidylyltransferase [Desulfobacteraceae bacterium]|nr:MAG: acylneuraminate cytidylyltransferase [Desulfobacteraceae bacterium]
MGKTVAIIQARMGSTRLPGKVMKDLCGKPVLEHVIRRVSRMKEIDEIVIATTCLPQDIVIEELSERLSVKCFRGSENDVLSRYYFAAMDNIADHIVRITSDCPLFDPAVGDSVVRFYKEHDYDIVSNAGALDSRRTFPPGLDTEVFSFPVLAEAFHNAVENYQREHVTPYMYEDPDNLVFHFHGDHDYSHFRWTLDTEEDFELIRRVYEELFHGEHDFFMPHIVDLMIRKPTLACLNAGIQQKKYSHAG